MVIDEELVLVDLGNYLYRYFPLVIKVAARGIATLGSGNRSSSFRHSCVVAPNGRVRQPTDSLALHDSTTDMLPELTLGFRVLAITLIVRCTDLRTRLELCSPLPCTTWYALLFILLTFTMRWSTLLRLPCALTLPGLGSAPSVARHSISQVRLHVPDCFSALEMSGYFLGNPTTLSADSLTRAKSIDYYTTELY